MEKLSSVSFFCPAYYDEENIPHVVKKADELLKKISKKYEIIVVEDYSPDRTGEVADELTKKYKNMKVIHHKKNKGYGGALKTGFTNAKYNYVMFTDGDNQYDVLEFNNLIPLLKSCDVVAGYVTKKAASKKRKLQSQIYNFCILFLFGFYFKDINCSMKIFKKKVLDSMEIKSESAFIDAEIIIKAKRKKFKIKRIEVTHQPRLHGVAGGAKFKVIFSTFKEMMKFRLGIIKKL